MFEAALERLLREGVVVPCDTGINRPQEVELLHAYMWEGWGGGDWVDPQTGI